MDQEAQSISTLLPMLAERNERSTLVRLVGLAVMLVAGLIVFAGSSIVATLALSLGLVFTVLSIVGLGALRAMRNRNLI